MAKDRIESKYFCVSPGIELHLSLIHILIDHKYPCGDGGWIHYRVAGPEQFEDIQVLLTVKCS